MILCGGKGPTVPEGQEQSLLEMVPRFAIRILSNRLILLDGQQMRKLPFHAAAPFPEIHLMRELLQKIPEADTIWKQTFERIRYECVILKYDFQ